jgi:hypothetical protein
MSVNKRWVSLDRCLSALEENKLKEYYGKSDMLFFENETCSQIYTLYQQGNSDEEILYIIKTNRNYEQKFNQNVESFG